VAAENYQLLSSGTGFSRRRLYDFIVQHSQGGPYVFFVHLLPDIASDGIRRLQLLTHNTDDGARAQNKKPTESRRAA